MPKGIRIYFEGDQSLKPGFAAFFKEVADMARQRHIRFQLISSGPGSKACSDFDIACRTHQDDWNILLIDSEGSDNGRLGHDLCESNKWEMGRVKSIFWMVQMMEAWFLADKECLEDFYGQGFNSGALKSNSRVEEIPKEDLKQRLRRATKASKRGCYFDNKTSHGPKLLEKIDPKKVERAAEHCKLLFKALRTYLQAQTD